MSDIATVIITGEVEKLPSPFAAYADPQHPLPPQVAFFEKRITLGQMLGTVAFAVGFLIVSVCSIIIGIAIVFSNSNTQIGTSVELTPVFFGLVCLLVAWMMASSLRTRWNMMQRQQRGEATRLGIFLTPEALFEANEFGYCIVPRAYFRGIANENVQYVLNDQLKTFRLPNALIKGDTVALVAAINAWEKNSPATAGG